MFPKPKPWYFFSSSVCITVSVHPSCVWQLNIEQAADTGNYIGCSRYYILQWIVAYLFRNRGLLLFLIMAICRPDSIQTEFPIHVRTFKRILSFLEWNTLYLIRSLCLRCTRPLSLPETNTVSSLYWKYITANSPGS